MMSMTAMQSMLDANMVYLDVSAGIAGFVLFLQIVNCGRKTSYAQTHAFVALFILLARLLTDFIYHRAVSKTDFFGGSIREFGLSSLAWLAMMRTFTNMSLQDIGILYTTSVIMMFAIARLTHWG